MHIFITGGTGLIGRRLCRHWSAAGHRLTVLSRRPERVAELCGREVRGVSSFEAVGDEQVDAVVNLAGEPIAERPWTSRRKALLWDSRVRLTERLVEWLEGRSQRPSVLISGSAVGWYGDAGERPLDEGSAAAGEDFASELCLAWEQIAMQAEGLGIRVVRLRTGLVLAPEGGFLARLAGRTQQDVMTYMTIPSTISGGPSIFQLHLGSGEVLHPGDESDVLVAFYQDSYNNHIASLREGGYCLYDSGEVAEFKHERGIHHIGIPFTSATIEATGGSSKDRGKNMFVLGLLCAVFQLDRRPAAGNVSLA